MFLRLLLAFVGFGIVAALLAVLILTSPVGTVAVILIIAVLAVLPAWAFSRSFVAPLRDIRTVVNRVAQGELGQRVHGGMFREGRELAAAVNEMNDRLTDRIDRLTAERQQLRAVLGGMVEGVVAVGRGQRVLFANEAAGKMLEFDPATATGRPLYEVSRKPAVQTLLEKALKSGQPHREGIEINAPATRHLTVYVAPLTGPEALGAVLVLDDTSELRRLERLRQEFVANVSHELKTPLAVITACAETLLDGAAEDADARGTFLHQIAEQADRLHALILDLLSLARIESGEEAMDFQAVSVTEAVAACLDRHRPRADAKQMVLEAMPPPAELNVRADEEALGQILDNLIDNAVKYTQAGGTIRVSWATDAGFVNLSVEDNGPGIPERDLSRIFERFYRVDRARSRELGGTGLGLSIVKHLAQAMGGSVKATSEVGKGTTFTVCLPKC
jgi:two-component system, OmpR family, phosphate regulon sensor histidine kinase PhoR